LGGDKYRRNEKNKKMKIANDSYFESIILKDFGISSVNNYMYVAHNKHIYGTPPVYPKFIKEISRWGYFVMTSKVDLYV